MKEFHCSIGGYLPSGLDRCRMIEAAPRVDRDRNHPAEGELQQVRDLSVSRNSDWERPSHLAFTQSVTVFPIRTGLRRRLSRGVAPVAKRTSNNVEQTRR